MTRGRSWGFWSDLLKGEAAPLPGHVNTAESAALPGADASARLWLPVALIAGLVPVLVTPVLPLIDFYNHIYRFETLARLPDDPLLAANYAANWALLPNIGLDVIAVALLHVVPVAVLPHLLVVLIMVTMFGGVVAFNRALTGADGRLTALLVLPLLYSWILNWGFANFLFGLGLAFVAAAAWLRLRPRPLLRLAVAVPAAILIYLCHGVAFALYGLLIAALEAGAWWQSRPRRPLALVQALSLCLVQAVVPVLLFLTSRTVTASAGVSTAGENAGRLIRNGGLAERLQALAAHRLETIVRVAEGPGLLVDALWLAAVLALLLWLWRARQTGIAATAWPAIGVGILLTLLCPPSLFGIAYIADRMPLFLALVLVGSLWAVPGLSWRQPAMLGLAALVAVRLVSVAVTWHGTADDLDDLDRVAARLPAGQLLVGYWPQATPHPEVAERCEMYLHVLALRHGQLVPLFAEPTAQPIALAGRLAAAKDRADAAIAPLRAQAQTPAVAAERVALLRASGFDHVLLCQPAADRPLPPPTRPVLAESGRFRLLAAEGAP